MPTPGSTVESQTPMIPLERRMERAYDRLLQRSEENAKLEISRGADARQFGRIILQFERLNNNMTVMQQEIRRDIRARRRYFEAEKKLLKKDSDNLDAIRSTAFFNLRRDLSAFAALSGVAALSQGDVGTAASNFGIALVPWIPEIAIGVAGLLGLGGGGRGGTRVPGVTRGVGTPRGGGRLGLLLPIAALAASLLMGQANAADQRRKGLTVTETKTPVINTRDAERFRGQLNRFEQILIGLGAIQETDTPKSTIVDSPQETGGIGGIQVPNVDKADFLGKVQEISGKETPRVQPPPPEDLGKERETTKKLDELVSLASREEPPSSAIPQSKFLDLAAREEVLIASSDISGLNLGKSLSQADVRRLQNVTETNESLKGSVDGLISSLDSGLIEGDPFNRFGGQALNITSEDTKKSWDIGEIPEAPKLNPSKNIGKNVGWFSRFRGKESTGSSPTVVNVNNAGERKVIPPPPTGQGASTSPWVTTKYTRSGGAFDKFDYALSLKTYAAFT